MKNKNRGDDYLIERIDKAIGELVFPKYKLQKAYNYYNGKRDVEHFRYLEENFGIGNPTSMEFTPLISKHVNALIGEYLGVPLLPKVSCKDEKTLSKITRELELKIDKEINDYLKLHLNNQILQFLGGKDVVDHSIEDALNKLAEEINDSFVSNYEIAAQNVIEFIIQSRNIDLINKLKTLLLDLLTTGSSFFKVMPTTSKSNIKFKVYSPLNTFVDKNPDSNYVNDGYRAVIREWLTKQQILNLYQHELDKDAKDELDDMFEGVDSTTYTYVRAQANVESSAAMGLDAGREAVPGYPSDNYASRYHKLIPVYTVEWIDLDGDIMNRYEGVRIGQSIYVLTGLSPNIIRTQDEPEMCKLSLNGLFFTNRDNEPYSLVLSCAHLQDKFDLINYMRDNVLANSGTRGDWLDLSVLPEVLGDDLTERIEKFIAYKKTGVGIIDTSQEGRAFNNNTSFAGFDDSIQANVMQAFDLALQRIEDTTSSITGVFRERLNGIQQKDAVSNVAVGAQNSFIITKQYYQQMDTLSVDILTDCLNIAKIVWKKGITGKLILGDKLQKVFTALPEHFTFTDYDIHITSSSQIMQDMKSIQAIVVELIKGGLLEADSVVDALTAKSLTDLRAKVQLSLSKKKKEANQQGQMQQQMQQMQQQLQQSQQQLEQANQKVASLNEEQLKIEREKVKVESDINWFKAKTERDFKSNTAENDNKRTEIEYAQLRDGDMMNNNVKDIMH